MLVIFAQGRQKHPIFRLPRDRGEVKTGVDLSHLQDLENGYLAFFPDKYNRVPFSYSTAGYRYTPEALDTIRQKVLQRMHTLETKKRIGQANQGFRHTLETRPKIQQLALARNQKPSDETKLKISVAKKHKLLSEAHKQALRKPKTQRMPVPNPASARPREIL